MGLSKLLKEARGNAIWDLIKWLWGNGPVIWAALIAITSGFIGWLGKLPLPALLVLTFLCGIAAYAALLVIVRRFGIEHPRNAPLQDAANNSPKVNTSLPKTMFAAIGRLGNLLDEGEHMIRQFGEGSPTRDRVNEWWLRVLEIAALPSLEDYVRPKDVAELKLSSPDDPELLLSAAAADRGERWVFNSERIQTYHILNVHTRRLKTFIDKINAQ